MDFPLIEEGMNQLENHTLVSDLRFSVLLLAVAVVAAAVAGIIFSKLQFLRFRRRKALIRLPSFYSFSEGFDEDDASISSSDGEEEEEESEKEEEERSEKLRGAKAAELGNFSFSSFSLADLVGGMGVVKAWEGLGLGFDGSGGGDFSLFDLSRGEIVRSFSGGGEVPMVNVASPAEIVSAADEAGRGAVVRMWDARAGDESPAATAQAVLRRRVTGVSAREGKVFVGDGQGEVAELDLRNLRAQVEGGDSDEGLGSWWRNAARCLPILSPRLEKK